MAIIGSLNLVLGATTSALEKGLGKARASIAGFKASMSGGSLGSLASLALPALSVGAVTAYGKSVLDSAEANLKLAERVGSSVAQVQALEVVANRTSTELSAVASAMDRANKVIGEAKGGSKSAQEALAALGVSAADLGTGGVDSLGILADRINAISDPATKAAVASDIFGRGWANISGVLAQGSAGLKAVEANLQAAGVAMSDETAAALDEAGDKIDAVWAKFDLVGTSLIGNLAEPLGAVADALSWVGAQAGQAVADLQAMEASALSLVSKAGAGLVEIFDAVTFGQTGAGDLADELWAASEGAASYAEQAHAAGSALSGLDVNAAGVAENMSSLEATGEGLAEVAKAQASTVEAAAVLAADDVTDDVIKLTNSLAETAQTFGLSKTEAELFMLAQRGATEEQLAIAGAWAKQVETLEREAAAREEATQAAEALASEVESFTESLVMAEATQGLSTEQAKLYELATKGATEAQLAQARALVAAKEAEDRAAREAENLAALQNTTGTTGIGVGSGGLEELRLRSTANGGVLLTNTIAAGLQTQTFLLARIADAVESPASIEEVRF